MMLDWEHGKIRAPHSLKERILIQNKKIKKKLKKGIDKGEERWYINMRCS